MEPPLDDDATQPPEEEDLTDPPFTAAEVLTDPDVLASIMGQLGLRLANLTAATCSAWKHASKCAQEEQMVLRPSHSLGWGNEALGQFKSPSGIIMLPTGNLCVADTNNHRLQVLSRSGEVRGVVGHGPGAGSGEFQQPTGLACDGRFLYVADSGNCRLHKLSLPEFKPVATIGSFGEAPGQLHAPVGLALHDDNRPPGESPGTGSLLFCADSRNHRIAVFTTHPELRFIRTFGSHGTAPGELGPTSSGIYLAAADGELFVADRANHRLQVFSTAEGQRCGRLAAAPRWLFPAHPWRRGLERRLITAECERVRVQFTGLALRVMKMDGCRRLSASAPIGPRLRRRSDASKGARALLPGRGPRGLWTPRCENRTFRPFCCRRPSATRRTRRSSSDQQLSHRLLGGARPTRSSRVRANITYTTDSPGARGDAWREGCAPTRPTFRWLRCARRASGRFRPRAHKRRHLGPQMMSVRDDLAGHSARLLRGIHPIRLGGLARAAECDVAGARRLPPL